MAMEEKIALPPFGGNFGGNGVREKSFLRSRVQLASATRSLSTRSRYYLYSFSGVRHVCHDNDGRFVYTDPVSQVTSIKAG